MRQISVRVQTETTLVIIFLQTHLKYHSMICIRFQGLVCVCLYVRETCCSGWSQTWQTLCISILRSVFTGVYPNYFFLFQCHKIVSFFNWRILSLDFITTLKFCSKESWANVEGLDSFFDKRKQTLGWKVLHTKFNILYSECPQTYNALASLPHECVPLLLTYEPINSSAQETEGKPGLWVCMEQLILRKLLKQG